MNIDNNYDYQEWYLRDLTATQTAQENKLSQKAPDNTAEPEKQARTDVVDFGANAKNAVEARLANGVSAAGETEQNDLAQAATTQDNQLSKGTAAVKTDAQPAKTDKKPELTLRLHTANLDRYEGVSAPKNQQTTTEETSETNDNKQKITAAQQRSIAAYQQQQGYTNSLVMSQNLVSHL